MAWLAIQSVFLALTTYFSIYDEHIHLIVVRYYAAGASPFGGQSPDLLHVGDISREAWLYHWSMGQVYRFFELIGFDGHGAWIGTRVVSALLASAAIVFVYLAFRELGIGPGAANAGIFLMAFTPLLVYVNSILNWDGVGNALLALSVWLALRLYNADTFRPGLWLGGLIAVVATSLTKNVLMLFLAPLVVIALGRQLTFARRGALGEIRTWFTVVGRRRIAHWMLAALALLALVLFVERYVVNILQFGSVRPACDVVQPIAVCEHHGIWVRNRELRESFTTLPSGISSAVTYTQNVWLPQMARTSNMFGVYSRTWGAAQSLGPNIAAWISSFVIPSAGVSVAFALLFVRIKRGVWMLLVAIAVAFGAQLLFNYSMFLEMGVLTLGVQGRYALPFIPFLFGLFTYAVAKTLGRLGAVGRRALALLVALALVGATQGGGAGSFIAVADHNWWGPQEGVAANIISRVSNVVRTVTIRDDWIPNPHLTPAWPPGL